MKSALLNYAIPSHGDNMPDLVYDHETDMNLVEVDEKKVPFIESSDKVVAITTKTEAMQEADDAFDEMLMLATKTFSEMESDDAEDTAYNE